MVRSSRGLMTQLMVGHRVHSLVSEDPVLLVEDGYNFVLKKIYGQLSGAKSRAIDEIKSDQCRILI